MGGLYKLSQKKQPVVMINNDKNCLAKKNSDLDNEYVSTPEKKEKYNKMSKQMATKLAFKNLKATLFKNSTLWKPSAKSQTDSTSASDGEQATAISPKLATVLSSIDA